MPTATRSDKINLSSEKQTEELANKFLKKISPGNIVFLYGEIGVGKTTFIRYLINGFQKANKQKITEITSPTFNLLNEYQINHIKINHYDLFRLKSEEEIRNLDLFEDSSNIITLIEWPEIISKNLKDFISLNFRYENDFNKRSVTISTNQENIINEF